MTPTTAILLAAGLGRRLGDPRPKCLLEMGGHTLLEHQVQALRGVGVQEVVVVVGHQGHLVRAHAAGLHQDVRWRFVHAPEFAQSNTLWSLARARGSLRSGAFVVNGDVLFGLSALERLVSAGTDAIAVEVRPCGPEEVKVQVDLQDRVVALSKQVCVADCLGEGVGISLFTGRWGQALAELLSAWGSREVHRHAYYEAAMEVLLPRLPLRAVPLAGEPVIEIDFPEDLIRATDEIVPRLTGAWR